MKNGFFRTSDDTSIYYEIEGQGQPLLLVHGWSCSNKFYQKNVEGLKNKFTVITIDLRGHGKSSKGLHGYTIRRMATDIYELIEFLHLEDVILMGWSMGGPTVLCYWKLFKDNSHLAGLGLIDMTPFPFSPGAWNSHGLHNYNAEGFNAFQEGILGNHEGFVDGFIVKMFKDCKMPAGTEWIKEECMKMPAYIGVALYSDYVYSDFTDVLATITVPTLVFCANSGIFPHSKDQGAWIAKEIPQGKCVPFEDGGHMLFYVEADKFNKAVIDEFTK